MKYQSLLWLTLATVVITSGALALGEDNDINNVDASEDNQLAVPDFIKCMAKCLGKSLADVEQWYKECGKNAKCWAKKAGFKALKCAPKCLKLSSQTLDLDEDNDINDVDASQYDQLAVPDFIKCMAKCLGKSLADVEQWYKECGKKAKCWAKKAGFKALKCVPKCLKLNSQFDLVSWLEEDASPQYDEIARVIDAPINNRFADCMAKCLGRSVDDIEKWIDECGSDVNCWIKKVGFAALKCVPRCITIETVVANMEVMTSTSQIQSSRFDKCMGSCLKKSVDDIAKWFLQCNINVKCWVKKVGLKALVCVPKCIKWQQSENEQSQIDYTSTTIPEVTTVNDVVPSNNRFGNCLAKCLGRSVDEIEQWIAECGYDVSCWMKKVGFAALKCVPRCVAIDISVVQVELLTAAGHVTPPAGALVRTGSSRFEKCMAQCLGQSIDQIEKWIDECGTDVECWLKKVGIAAIKCLPQCIKSQKLDLENSYGSHTLTVL